MICVSDKCKIPFSWRMEIRSAVKHAPFPCDKITIDGKKMNQPGELDFDQLMEAVKYIDESIEKCKIKKKKLKKKKLKKKVSKK